MQAGEAVGSRQTQRHEFGQCFLKFGAQQPRRREYLVEKPEFIIVGDYTAGVLVSMDGVKRNAVVSLMNISSVIPHATPSKN